jgi:hypothetical protein
VAGRAQACPITLEGDAEVIDRVRAELGDFQDGGACVAVWARCRGTGDQIEVDLHDELGRSALHLFRSADGAAAFLISWSRRPLPDRAPGPPGLVEPGPSPAPAPPAQLDPLWRPEIGLAYVAASGAHSPWITATAAVTKHAGLWRYGGAGHIFTGVNGPTVTAEVEAALGVQTALLPRITVVSELFVGDAVVARGASFGGDMDYGAGGLRAGIRAGIDWQFSAPFGVELQWGYDVVQWSSSSATPAGSDGTSDVMRVWGLAAPNHVALGLRWLP